MARRVVVTGMAAISPLGNDVESTWKAMVEGRSGISRITKFDPSNLPVQIAAEVKGFSAGDFIHKKEIKKMDSFIHYALVGSMTAVQDAGLEIDDVLAPQVGVAIGTGIGGLPAIEDHHKTLLSRGPEKVSPFFIPMVIGNLAGGQVAIFTNAKGPNITPVTACASGAHAIGEALRMIQRGDAEIMITGGTEAAITPLALAGFDNMRAISRRNDSPEEASRPFERDRDGFVLGEGAGVIILEEKERAEKRGARIYAEITGYGATCDAFHLSSPSPNGDGAVRAMRAALKEGSEINSTPVGYINAHGTGTRANDVIETKAIRDAFGVDADTIMISSTKSMTGHLLGAAGGVEAIASILAIRDGVLPPTINHAHPDPECDLDYIPNQAREVKVDAVLSNSFGFGGTNACLLFHRV